MDPHTSAPTLRRRPRAGRMLDPSVVCAAAILVALTGCGQSAQRPGVAGDDGALRGDSAPAPAPAPDARARLETQTAEPERRTARTTPPASVELAVPAPAEPPPAATGGPAEPAPAARAGAPRYPSWWIESPVTGDSGLLIAAEATADTPLGARRAAVAAGLDLLRRETGGEPAEVQTRRADIVPLASGDGGGYRAFVLMSCRP